MSFALEHNLLSVSFFGGRRNKQRWYVGILVWTINKTSKLCTQGLPRPIAAIIVLAMPDTIRRASDDVALAIRMVARLKEETVARQMEALFYPNEHVSVISSITANGYYLTTQLNIRDSRIDRLEKRLTKLEIDSDNQEQYTIRPNVRIHGFSEQGDDTTDDNVLFVINNTLWLTPKLVLTDVERSHRLGP